MKMWKQFLLAATPTLALPPVTLLPQVAHTADVDAAVESVSVVPSALKKIQVRKKSGDIDNRPVSVEKEGLMIVGPGDRIEVNLKVPADLVGKRGSFTIEYKIREEYNKDCKKHVIRHPRSLPVEFDAPLRVGKNVHVEVILESLADPNVTVTYRLQPGRNEPVRVQAGARVRVKYHLPAESVEFDGRQELTQIEIDRHVEPELAALRRNPNVEFCDPVFTNVAVKPGNLGELAVELKASRGRR